MLQEHCEVTYHRNTVTHTTTQPSHILSLVSHILALSNHLPSEGCQVSVLSSRAIFSDKLYLKSALPPFALPSLCLTSLYTAHEYDRVPTLKLYPSLCYPAAAQQPSVAGEQKNDHMKKSIKHKRHVNMQPNSKVTMQIFKSFKKCNWRPRRFI